MITMSLDGKRILFSTTPRKFYRVYVKLTVNNPAVLPPFTGKVVKSLLIKGNPDLEKIFEQSEPDQPKPIHVTPLGFKDNNTVKFLWKKSGRNNIIIQVMPDQEYFFIVSFSEEVSEATLNALVNLNGIKLFNTRWDIISITTTTYKLPSTEPLIRLDDARAVKVLFRSPVQPIDPYRKSVFKRLNILPGVLFAYNAGEITRMYRRGPGFWRVLDYLNYVLVESKTFWKTVRLVNVLYDDLSIPALTGYVKYWVNLEDVDDYVKLLVENVLSHAVIMGIGSSRSIGLGHVDIRIE